VSRGSKGIVWGLWGCQEGCQEVDMSKGVKECKGVRV